MKKVLYILLPLFLCMVSCRAVVILVHGSFATQSTWSRPYGAFYQELEKQAQLLGKKLISFSWSGKPNSQEIFMGGSRLAKLIESYPEDEEIILVGHSHGGNVINCASQCLYDPARDGQYDKKLQALLHGCDANRENTSENIFEVTPKENIGLGLSATTRTVQQENKPRIARAYYLGTPVDATYYKPEMSVIGLLCNLYSLGDQVQKVGGVYQRTYPETLENVINFSVTIGPAGPMQSIYPGHSELHKPVVASWLLQIPAIFIPELSAHHERGEFNFLSNFDGRIHFEDGKFPEFHAGNMQKFAHGMSLLNQKTEDLQEKESAQYRTVSLLNSMCERTRSILHYFV